MTYNVVEDKRIVGRPKKGKTKTPGRRGPKPREKPDLLDALIIRLRLENPGIKSRKLAKLCTQALKGTDMARDKPISHTTVSRRIKNFESQSWADIFTVGLQSLAPDVIDSYRRGLNNDDPNARRELATGLGILQTRRDGNRRGDGVGNTAEDIIRAVDRLTTGEIQRAIKLLQDGPVASGE